MAITLVILEDDGRRRELELGKPVTLIGRGANNDVVIQDPRSSRKHCSVRPTPQGVLLEDLGSSNGTLVRGQAVTKTLLQPGDEFRVGKTRFQILDPTAQSEGPAVTSTPGEPVPSAPSERDTPVPRPQDLKAAETILNRTREMRASPSSPGILASAPAATPAPAEWEISGRAEDEGEAYLEVEKGDKSGERIRLDKSPFTIGRASRCDFVIKDPRVSSQHARIVRHGGDYVIEDLESKNGTFVDRKKISRASIASGNLITIGDMMLRARLGGVDAPREEVAPGVIQADGVQWTGKTTVLRADASQISDRLQDILSSAVLFLVLGLLAVLGIALPRWLLVSEEIDPRSQSNRILRNWSFEELPSAGEKSGESVPGWTLAVGDEGKLELTEQQAQYPGRKALKLTSLGDPNGCAAHPDSPVKLRDVQEYHVEGYVANQGAFLTGFLVDWLLEGREDFRVVGRSYVHGVRGRSNATNVYQLVTAPQGASHARVSCFVYGTSGSAIFDRVSFSPASTTENENEATEAEPPGSAPRETVPADEELVFTMGADSNQRTIELQAEGDFSLEAGHRQQLSSCWAGIELGRDPLAAGMRLQPTTVEKRGPLTAVAFGEVADVDSERWVGVGTTVRADDEDLSVTWSLTADDEVKEPERVVVYLECRDPALSIVGHGAERSGRMRFSEARGGPYAELVLGGQAQRTSLEFSSPVRLKGGPHPIIGNLWLLAVQPSDSTAELSVSIRYGSRHEARAAAALVAQAEKLFEDGKIAEAIQGLDRVTELYPRQRTEIDIDGTRHRWLKETTKMTMRLEAGLEELKRNPSPVVYESLKARAERYRTAVGGKKVEALLKQLDEFWMTRATRRTAAEEDRLLRQGRDHLERNELGLAELYARLVLSSPGEEKNLKLAEDLLRRIDGRRKAAVPGLPK